MSRGLLRRHPFAGWVLAVAGASSACEPELVVGKKLGTEQEPACSPPDGNAGAPAALDKVVEVPWSTSYEDDFCDYRRSGGFCYGDIGSMQETVEDPVHLGQRAAAFSITSNIPSGMQSRCFLEGQLPVEAVYGAWFYLPSLATNTGNWNLIHFQGGTPPNDLPGLWDVSLANAADGSLYLYLFDFLGPGVRTPDNPPEVPIGSWFNVEFRLLRAADATGEVELRQDGALVMELTGIVTDDTSFGQWYVGNLADALTPPESTIYVDDVTISAP